MAENQERIFADGFVIKRRDNAPEFVIANISVKVDEAIAFLRKYEKNGWVNLNAKTGRSGNPYIELDTFEPKGKGGSKPKAAEPEPTVQPEEDGDLPF
jgi:hypothetical protein